MNVQEGEAVKLQKEVEQLQEEISALHISITAMTEVIKNLSSEKDIQIYKWRKIAYMFMIVAGVLSGVIVTFLLLAL